MKKIEKEANKTIKEECIEIKILNTVFMMRRPTLATLYKASELICDMPEKKLNINEATYEVLGSAKDYSKIAEIIATLLLGEKRKKNFFDKRKFKKTVEFINYNCSPSVIYDAYVKTISAIDIKDFFLLTTSLSEINMLRATKKIKTTHLSQ